MKVLIQGLGEVPIPVEMAMAQEKPDVTYVVCSDYQLNYIYPKNDRPNREVVRDAARSAKTKLIFKRCDVFDPKSIHDCLLDILRNVDPNKDEIIFNYTSGSSPVRLFLGVLGVQLSKFTKNTKILYTISYPEKKVRISDDHAGKLKELLPTDMDLLLDLFLGKSLKGKKGIQR